LLIAVALVILAALPARADDLGAAVNAARGSTLAVDGVVDGFAQAAAERLLAGQDLVHSDLSPLLGRCSAAGEVIGYGPDVPTLMQAFAKSPTHWTVIMNNKWNAVGTGGAVDGSGRLWVAVVFCTLPGAPPPLPPPTTAPRPAPAPATTTPPTTTTTTRAVPDLAGLPAAMQGWGPIVGDDGSVSVYLGASPFLPPEEWSLFTIPAVT
jgi:hypothetical protein